MSSEGPIETLPLFPELSRRFVALLESLALEDWQKPVSATWRVRDVVSHLLDGSLRRISAQRDGYGPQTNPPKDGYATLVEYLNQLNADWVKSSERLSPRVLTELIRWSDERLHALLSSLDPTGLALWPVAWAGETQSQNWFDIAREYTEKWHHAQQVFDATGRPSTINNRELMYPCLDTFMRGLPHALRECDAAPGAGVRVTLTGTAGGEWTANRDNGTWKLGVTNRIVCAVTMQQDDAWKKLTKRLSKNDILSRFKSVQISGDETLCSAMLEMVCVMA